MRVLKICGCLLLLAPLLGTLGCGGSAYVKKGPEVEAKTVKNTVKISNCKADPDTVKVPDGDTLTWVVDPPDGHTYSIIDFPKSRPVPTPTVPIGQPQKVKKDFWCKTLGGISTSLCVYPYNPVQDGTPCPDPGVHVGP